MKHINSFSFATLLLSLAALFPLPPAYSQSAGISGERAYSRLRWNKKTYTLNPNQVGNFSTLTIPAQTYINISVIYPAGQADEKVTLSAMEGGSLGNGQSTQDVTLDSLKTATFTFATGSGRGLYRVLVCKGIDCKILEFWVGEKLPTYTE